jgi:hypothetical protein
MKKVPIAKVTVVRQNKTCAKKGEYDPFRDKKARLLEYSKNATSVDSIATSKALYQKNVLNNQQQFKIIAKESFEYLNQRNKNCHEVSFSPVTRTVAIIMSLLFILRSNMAQ